MGFFRLVVVRVAPLLYSSGFRGKSFSFSNPQYPIAEFH